MWILSFMSFLSGAFLLSSTSLGYAQEGEVGKEKNVSPTALSRESSRTLPDFINLAEQLSAAVVNISIVSAPSSLPSGGPPLGRNPREREEDSFREFWEPFERFFSPFPPHSFRQKSLGSGVILDQQGYILTNNHVVENAEEIWVTLTNEKEYRGTLVGADPKTDLALLKIDGPEHLTVIALGDSDQLHVGEWVLAIGNPFGLDHTVTAGIVSAKGRNIGRGSYDQFIQTDASINPGNSGGPLINLQGEVVGINTAIYSRTGGNVGIGFAIPINVAKDLMPQLKAKGKVTRGWIGVMIQKVTPEVATAVGLADARGARIAEIMPDGPAQAAGLTVGDVIVSFNGREVRDSSDLPLLVARTPIGETVDLVVVRENKKRQTVKIHIAELHEEQTAKAASPEPERLGLTVQDLSPTVRNELGLREEQGGVVVAQIVSGSVAEEAGIQQKDVILEVNRQKVPDVPSYHTALQKTVKGEIVLLLIRRGESTFFLTLKATG
jgi:serine protease Do